MHLEQVLARRGMDHGPYLVFLRSRIGFVGPHDFDEWECLARILDQQMWGEDALVTMFSTPQDLACISATDAPEWVDTLEIASIAVDYAGHRPPEQKQEFVADWGDDDEDRAILPTVANLMHTCRPGATPDKVAFDRRLLLVLFDDPEDRRNVGTLEAAKHRLGSSAVSVWYSRDIFGVAFRDQRQPAMIMESLGSILSREEVFDAGIFKLCGAVSVRPAVSRLHDFLGSRP